MRCVVTRRSGTCRGRDGAAWSTAGGTHAPSSATAGRRRVRASGRAARRTSWPSTTTFPADTSPTSVGQRALRLALRAVHRPAELAGTRHSSGRGAAGRSSSHTPGRRSRSDPRTASSLDQKSWMDLGWARSGRSTVEADMASDQGFCGAQRENRTLDLRITSALLYRLSYLGRRVSQCSDDVPRRPRRCVRSAPRRSSAAEPCRRRPPAGSSSGRRLPRASR